ncbi:hypothetical protein AVEN_228272-1 [Araneus ventricosus]|uniref:Uncharacterized protein n=1 Tax=Araneus ventricosus TaxID=182803 RepID=A0A4Y2NW06_ARAVE|nr:hypothetical protein AVEN_228272-1 [Araneus ventricosus]
MARFAFIFRWTERRPITPVPATITAAVPVRWTEHRPMPWSINHYGCCIPVGWTECRPMPLFLQPLWLLYQLDGHRTIHTDKQVVSLPFDRISYQILSV